MYLFMPVAKGMVSKDEMHLALITKVLGPAPQDLVRSGRSGKLMYSRRRGELHNFPQDGLGSQDLKKLIGKRRGKPFLNEGATPAWARVCGRSPAVPSRKVAPQK